MILYHNIISLKSPTDILWIEPSLKLRRSKVATLHVKKHFWYYIIFKGRLTSKHFLQFKSRCFSEEVFVKIQQKHFSIDIFGWPFLSGFRKSARISSKFYSYCPKMTFQFCRTNSWRKHLFQLAKLQEVLRQFLEVVPLHFAHFARW